MNEEYYLLLFNISLGTNFWIFSISIAENLWKIYIG